MHSLFFIARSWSFLGFLYDNTTQIMSCHDDVIKWKHFPHYWPFVRGIHRWPVNSPHKGQWCGALLFFFICAWMNGCVNNREAGDLRRHHSHCDVTVTQKYYLDFSNIVNKSLPLNIKTDYVSHRSLLPFNCNGDNYIGPVWCSSVDNEAMKEFVSI